MSDDHDDLLNFEMADGDFADGTLNEDELLLSDEDRDEFDEEEPVEVAPTEIVKPPPTTQREPAKEPQEAPAPTDEPSDTGQVVAASEPSVASVKKSAPVAEKPSAPAPESTPHVDQPSHAPPLNSAQRQPYRQKFPPRWPNAGPPRWNPGQPPQQMPFQRGPNMGPRPMMGPQRQMRPFGPHSRPPFNFNNNFMQSRPPLRPPPMSRPRFFYPNQGPPMGDPSMQGGHVFAPLLNMGGGGPPAGLPRKVHINPNFKGGVEAAKNQLLKDQFFSTGSSVPEDELLKKQQEFINHNMRQIEKRRHERTPSPEYRRGYSRSPSPQRYRRRPYNKNFDWKRENEAKAKDENQPEEDEETRAYRQQIESQRKKREEILRQKEMRRRQQAEQKAKETQPAEPLQPIVVTEKKIVLKRKTPDRSTTPPIKDAPITPTRRIVLKPSKDAKLDAKPTLADGSKRKIQKILSS